MMQLPTPHPKSTNVLPGTSFSLVKSLDKKGKRSSPYTVEENAVYFLSPSTRGETCRV